MTNQIRVGATVNDHGCQGRISHITYEYHAGKCQEMTLVHIVWPALDDLESQHSLSEFEQYGGEMTVTPA